MKAAIYARVSTHDQNPKGQVEEATRYCKARDWKPLTFVDHGESGEKERRPEYDRMLTAARARHIDVVVCTRLDRLARSLRQLVNLGAELYALGVQLVVISQQIDTTTPGGRPQFHMMAAYAEFERDLIAERVKAGVRRKIMTGGRWGPRPRKVPVEKAQKMVAKGLGLRAIARRLKVPRTTLRRALQSLYGR